MPDTSPKLEPFGLQQYLALAWKWAWLMALLTVLAAGAAYLIGRITPPVYQARTKLLVNEATQEDINDYTAILMSERQARTYAEMITNRLLLEEVITELDLDKTAKNLAGAIKVNLINDTRLIAITVEDGDPDVAALIANTVAQHFIRQLQSLENSAYQAARLNLEQQLQLMDEQMAETYATLAALPADADPAERERLNASVSEYRQTYANLVVKVEDARLAEALNSAGVVHLEPAIAVATPVSPRVFFNTLLAAAMGFLLAIGVMVFVEVLDDTIRSPDDVTRYLGLPVFGIIPQHTPGADDLIMLSEPRSPASDAYRKLRTNIDFANVDHPLKTLVITSAMPGEGKSTISANLSLVIAQNARRTILLDSDFRRPNIHKVLGLSNRQGLSSLLAAAQMTFEDYMQALDGTESLKVLTTGSIPPNPTELLSSAKMRHILELLEEQADMVVMDTPPIVAVPDATVVASRSDGVLLVIRSGATHINAARQAVEQLQRAKANLLGVVLNAVDFRSNGYYSHYYYYHDNEEKTRNGFLKRFKRRL